MKKFTKLFLSCTAMAVVTAAVATSAMAAEITATYDADNNTATLTSDYTADQKTLLILAEGKKMSDLTSFSGSDISSLVIAIDQDAVITSAALPTNLADGVYYVYMGGDGQVYETTMRKGQIVGETIKIGDVDGNGRIITSDANAILWYGVDSDRSAKVGKTINVSDGTTTLVGDVDGNGRIITSDANAILWYGVDSDRSAKVGNEITGAIVD